jgi:ribose transport system ATP-binding protein
MLGMDGAESILEIRGLAKAYGAVVALRSADVTVRAGEQHGIMGANGAGKSTLVKILTGVVRADAGTISVAGHARAIRSPVEARRVGLSPVHQESSLIPDLSLEQNFRLTRTPLAAVQRWLDELGLRGVDTQALARDCRWRPSESLISRALWRPIRRS